MLSFGSVTNDSDIFGPIKPDLDSAFITLNKAGKKDSLKISFSNLKMSNILLLISIALFAGLGYSVPHGYYKKGRLGLCEKKKIALIQNLPGYKYYVPRVRYYTPVMKTRARAAGNIVEELTRNGASTLIDLAVKAGLADTLTGKVFFLLGQET